MGLIIGGLMPAVVYGFTNVFVKMSVKEGISPPMYVMAAGVGIIIAGAASLLFHTDMSISSRSASYAATAGFLWGAASFGVAYALQVYNSPIAKLVPLFNMNTLVAVLLGMWLFAEWKGVNSSQLILGSVLIVVGGTLVARA
ncbi:MAG: hypothetical protein O2904_04090 [bacterium]|nr:hypothetical protein [bacterium]